MNIFVVSMHRSGSSLIARIVNEMGAYIGETPEIMQARQDNPKGFWERIDVVNLHETTLVTELMTWDCPLPDQNPFSLSNSAKNDLNAGITDILNKVGDHEISVIKDPRLCLFLDHWLAKADNPVVLFIYRDPSAVSASLNRRNDMPLQEAMALWEYYSISALKKLGSVPVNFIDIDEFKSDVQGQTKRLHQWLVQAGCSSLRQPEETWLAEFYDPKLIHKPEQLPEAYFTSEAEALKEALENYQDSIDCGSLQCSPMTINSLRRRYERIIHPKIDLRGTLTIQTSDHGTFKHSFRFNALNNSSCHFSYCLPSSSICTEAHLDLGTLPMVVSPSRMTAELATGEEVEFDKKATVADLYSGATMIFLTKDPHIIGHFKEPVELTKVHIGFTIEEYNKSVSSFITNNLELILSQNASNSEKLIKTIGKQAKHITQLNGKVDQVSALSQQLSHKNESIESELQDIAKLIQSEKRNDAETRKQLDYTLGKLQEWPQKYTRTIEILRKKISIADNLFREDSIRVKKNNEQLIQLDQELKKNRSELALLHRQMELHFKIKAALQNEENDLEKRLGPATDFASAIKYVSAPVVFTGLATQPRRTLSDLFGKLLHSSLRKLRFFVKCFTPKGREFLYQYAVLKNTWLFDPIYYCLHNKDVITTYQDPYAHFLEYGGFEGRNPHPLFDTGYYLENRPDLRARHFNPLVHYLLSGRKEGLLTKAVDPNRDFRNKTDSEIMRQPAAKEGLSPEAPPRSPQVATALLANEPERVADEVLIGLHVPSNNEPVASIIIPVYNQVSCTMRCLHSLSLLPDSTPYEVIVVDDCSEDNTPDTLNSITGITTIRNESNLGFVGSCNRGADLAKGKYIVFLNNDTVVIPGWLDKLVQTFSRDESVGVAGSKLLYPDGTLQEAGGIIWSDGSGWNFGRNDDPSKSEYNYMRPVDFCSGASLAVETALWKRLGGFDPQFSPGYYEDADLCFAARNLGRKVVYQPRSQVVHFEGKTAGTDLTAGMKKYQIDNRTKFLDKWSEKLKTHIKRNQPTFEDYFRDATYSILFLDSTTPTPDRDAGSNVIIDFMQLFLNANAHVQFAATNLKHWGRYTHFLEQMGVENFCIPQYKSIEGLFKKIGGKIDAVFVYRWENAASFIPLIRKYAPKAKIVYDTVDLHYLRMEREAKISNDKSTAAEARRVKKLELQCMKDADQTILLSDKELEILQSSYSNLNLTYIPFSHDIPGRQAEFEERHDIGFLGGYQHPPNVDAVHYFVEEIWPSVHSNLPNVSFLVAGSSIPQEILELDKVDGVKVVGFVPELADLLNRCRLTVAPLRFGAGMKGKVISSLSYGVPTICTSVASEGVNSSFDSFFRADGPEIFAEMTVRMYTDEDLWLKTSDMGIELVANQFSRKAIWERLQTMMTGLGINL